jgi:hypothetical protein
LHVEIIATFYANYFIVIHGIAFLWLKAHKYSMLTGTLAILNFFYLSKLNQPINTR